MTAFAQHAPALVLNADFRPISYFPLSLWSWQNAIKAVFMCRVHVVSEYETMVHSPSMEMPLPSVIALKDYIQTSQKPAFTRFNVFLRDRFSCQYCGSQFHAEDLTFDHVVPRCRGGRTTWENVVAACSQCNLQKSNKTAKNAGLKLLKPPYQPNNAELHRNGQTFPPNYLHESWGDYLYWDSELESG